MLMCVPIFFFQINTESPLNIPKPEEEEEKEMASDKHEEEVKRDENVQPQNKSELFSEDTGTPSCQPPDPVQKETNPGSESGHDIKEESVRSSEAEEKQTEKTTEKQHHSVTEPKIDTEGEKGHTPEKNEDLSGDPLLVNVPKEDGPSGDILQDNAHKEDDEDTGTPSCQPPDPVQKETNPGSESGHDIKEESVRSSEAEEKQTESPLNIPKPEEEEEKEMASDKHEEEVKRDENVQPQNKSELFSEDTGTPSCQPPDPVQKETNPGSESGHDIKEESVRSSEAEEKQTESPLNIPKPEEEEEKEMASDKHEEEVKRDENVQPQNKSELFSETIWTAAVVILIALVCALCQRSPDSTSSKTKEVNVVDLFNQEMKKLETTFPNQHAELWRRSLIHLRRHLKTKNPTEPVSLILTSDRRAEKTLGCLALCLARAFSTAHNSSVLKINGKNKASQDSDQVKLDIDSELRKAFEGKKSAAVIHHFEELPPGSTLIFYRYCDHENAAYKDVFLAFTVMLDAEVELPSSVSLGRVEEMVQEHIKHKFVSSDKSAMFNQMDVDKLGGLWSRISHLILPVAAEKKIEEQGCVDCDK
ncbi:torsin-1A-interacting protein 2-like isoform X3 [Carassius carassius]|uniref:torsin-1A-interacting protein 2-like isoform X3 n=1 Tax=Carassius carassius TaxID=217509 RepID=UPI0028683D37|nr:torsin-1A-interacting protein 2-like isoform X3 [Carassius carassius]